MFTTLPPNELGEYEDCVRVPGVTTTDDQDEFGLAVFRLSSGPRGTKVSYHAMFYVDLCDMKCAIPLNRRDLLALIGMLLKGVGVIHQDERRRRTAMEMSR